MNEATEGSQQPGYPDIDPVQQGGSPAAASSQQEAATSPTMAHASPTAPQASPQGSNAAEAWQAIQDRMKPPLCQHGEPCKMKRTTKQGPNKRGCSCPIDEAHSQLLAPCDVCLLVSSCSSDCIPVHYVCSVVCCNPGSCGAGRYVYMCSRPPAADNEGQCKTFFFVDVYRSQKRPTNAAFP